jgi:hypothetical protein
LDEASSEDAESSEVVVSDPGLSGVEDSRSVGRQICFSGLTSDVAGCIKVYPRGSEFRNGVW